MSNNMTKEEREKRIEQVECLINAFSEHSARLSESIQSDTRRVKELAELIQQYKQELADLQKPKYTAKDFPCLEYFFGQGIGYIDNNNEYYISEKLKMISNPIKHSNEYIDDTIDIIPCKLSDIKVGEYFAFDNAPNKTICGYRYCTKVEIDNKRVYYDYGHEGYIKTEWLPYSGVDPNYVKFTLKDK